MDRELISKTEKFLNDKFDSGLYLNAHPDAKSYRLEHSYRVANIGRQIALEEGFDETEMVIRLLSFGPMVKVIAPESFVDLIKKRLVDQKSCGL